MSEYVDRDELRRKLEEADNRTRDQASYERLRDLVARAVNRADNEWASAPRTEPHDPWDQHLAGAVLAVPAIADALARDARVRMLRGDC